MGMFDYVRINPRFLPVSEEERKKLRPSCMRQFQTKSFQKLLLVIHITNQGKLRWLKVEWEAKTETVKQEDGTETDELIDFIPHNPYWVEEDSFTGTIRFYDNVDDVWYEFEAIFSNGQLQKIVKLSPEDERIIERLV